MAAKCQFMASIDTLNILRYKATISVGNFVNLYNVLQIIEDTEMLCVEFALVEICKFYYA